MAFLASNSLKVAELVINELNFLQKYLPVFILISDLLLIIVKVSRASKLIFTCSKSPIETLEKVRDMFKVNNKNTRTT